MQLNFEGQILAADTATRTIEGLVVPFGKVGNTSAGPVRFEFGAFGEVDASQIVLNKEHQRTDPLGRGVAGSEKVTPAGISMAFKIAATNAGNDALVEASEGLRPAFSIEASVNEYTIEKGVMVVSAANLEAVAHVTNPAFKDAQISQVAASEPDEETTEAELAVEEQPQENIVEETTAPVADEVTAAAVVTAAAPVAYSKPRSPINSQASYLEHSIKAKMGNHDSAQYVMAADDSFSTNPAFTPVQYVNSVIDTAIGSRPAIDAIGSRAITASGMVISHPKITVSGSVADTNEGAAPSETGIESAYVNLNVNKFAGMQRYSVELLERSSPDFFQAMVDNMTRQYNKATDAAVIAALTAGGTQATGVAATSAGIISYVSTEAPAAYLATGELPSAYIAGTSQWSLLMGATDTTGRPIYNAYNPQNNGGQAGPQSLRGNVLGLDLYVDPNAVATTIDESAFIVTPSAVAIYESPILRMSTNVVASGEIETMLYGYLACGVLVAGGVRRFNLT
ncbi:major_cap_HK97, phage major capsid protein, HK97 family [uncultured Caudovirales phage]|uniref:Major_cap_HK97, phage major capsid protein, HK97 family n=1 Tax=uncultured Caudovirales phage TaxID=2100421 RepID=A0A6J5MFH3_9CAUD|nr:major_cap_HK97, phage major capsid protein, HK97 family [uncultured Caudovirales phage]